MQELLAAIQRRIVEQEFVSANEKIIPDLIDFASRMFIAEEQAAWSPKLRSKTTPMQTPKRHLADVSLAAALLDAISEHLMLERETLGHFFESQVFHDLQIYAQSLSTRGVFHYRDIKGRDEIDIVVEGSDGGWVGVEVKLGQGAVEKAAENLKRVAAKIAREPNALIVITPTDIPHIRKDGVMVASIASTGP